MRVCFKMVHLEIRGKMQWNFPGTSAYSLPLPTAVGAAGHLQQMLPCYKWQPRQLNYGPNPLLFLQYSLFIRLALIAFKRLWFTNSLWSICLALLIHFTDECFVSL